MFTLVEDGETKNEKYKKSLIGINCIWITKEILKYREGLG